jgi:predicted porin
MIFVDQRFVWSIGPQLTFTEKARWKQFLESPVSHHWTLLFDLNYQMTANFSLFASYEIDNESSQVDQEVLLSEEEDTDLRVGIRLQF